MAIKEWSTDYPVSQDDPVTDNMPTLVNESGEGVGDGDATRVSQWHSLRDKLAAVAEKVGDNGRLPAGCLLDILNSDQTDAGFLRLRELTSNPANIANKGFLFCKDVSGTTELFYEDDGGSVTQLTPATSTDEKVKVSSDDTVTDYLENKLAAGNGITKTTLNPAGDEDLRFAADFGTASGKVCEGNDARLSPLTTKGDIMAFSNVNARLPVGSNDQVLTADSTQAEGVAWKTPAAGGTLDRLHIWGEDNQYTESGSSPVTKIPFRDINDSNKACSKYRAVATLWCSNAGATATLTLNIGTNNNTVTSTTNPSEADGAIVAVEVSSPGTDQRLTCSVQLHRSAGTGDVHFKYIDIYKVY